LTVNWNDIDLKKFKQIEYFFYPKSIALIGAGKSNPFTVANIILSNILSQKFIGSTYLVDIKPEKDVIKGLKVYYSISEVPEEIDLALIIVPASVVPKIIKDCIAAKVKAIIIISAGFSESNQYDNSGINLQKQIEKLSKNSDTRIVGPNCNGVYSQICSLNATLGPRIIVPPGKFSMVTKGGTAGIILSVAAARKSVGMNKCIGIGDECDLKLQDFIHYYEYDKETNIIGAYTEGIKEPKSFLKIVKNISKPLIFYKSGETKSGEKAAASHVAAIAGKNTSKIFEGVLKQLKVLKVKSVDEFIDLIDALTISPLPKGRKAGIWTPGGSMGVIMSDKLENEGIIISKLSNAQIEQLNKVLKVKYWSHGNPVDVTDSYSPQSINKTAEILLSGDNLDGLIILFGSGITEEADYVDLSFREEYDDLFKVVMKQQAKKFRKLIRKYQKPIFLLAENRGELGKMFRENGVIVLPTFFRIARTFKLLNQRFEYLQSKNY